MSVSRRGQASHFPRGMGGELNTANVPADGKLALAKGVLSVALMSISFKVVENPEGATLRNSFGNESLFLAGDVDILVTFFVVPGYYAL